jgi:hypothetical protein
MFLIACSVLPLGGCLSTSVQELSQSGTRYEFNIKGNYQEVYRKILTNAKKCFSANSLILSTPIIGVEAQLYPELGFGEINDVTYSLTNFYRWSARIERSNDDAKIIVFSKFEQLATKTNEWARGSSTC